MTAPTPFGLSALPPELRDNIVDRLAPRDVVRLGATSKQIQKDFAEAATVATLVRDVTGANLETIDRLLNATDRIANLSPHRQMALQVTVTGWLIDLATQVWRQNESERPTLFSELLRRAAALGADGGRVMTHLALCITNLPVAARHDAFLDLANRLKSLPVDHVERIMATLMLALAIPELPEEIGDEATRQTVEVLRPLPSQQHKFVLNMPDDQLSPAIKNALRQAIAEDEAAALYHAGTSAHA